ncbi:MAG TPA: hypothetical protein VKK79_25355 [Candidatus Lokiarchaeia archaeon]|nr:hypothetical protein [Candidatus Lokiarchaeia archaeon]
MPKPSQMHVGDVVPDFTLPDIGGTPVTLSKVLETNQYVVLALFRGYF